MDNIKKLQQERTKLFEDVNTNVIPKRIPIDVDDIMFDAIAQYGGFDLKKTQWNPAAIEEAADQMCEKIYSDSCPVVPINMRSASFYHILQSHSYVMSNDGFMQHPEVSGMMADEYDFLIDNPYECIIEKIIPRHFKGLSFDDPANMAFNFTKSIYSRQLEWGVTLGIKMRLCEKYGYYLGNRMNAGSIAPFDFLTDQLRGFSQIFSDIRRIPEKVIEACDAIYPLMLKRGYKDQYNKYSKISYALHMPTFMREKDFEKIFWPSFYDLNIHFASLGARGLLRCEDDWIRYLDYLQELPAGATLKFEKGDDDLQLIKDKVGKKHIITGLFPLTLLLCGTEQQCIDKAKEFIDILAPGGNYIFGLGQSPVSYTEKFLTNLSAVTEYVRDNGAYSNAGELTGEVFCKDDFKAPANRKWEFKSNKYYTTTEDYIKQYPDLPDGAAEYLSSFDEKNFTDVTNLTF